MIESGSARASATAGKMHETIAIRSKMRADGGNDRLCAWKNLKRIIGILYSNSEEEKSPIRAILEETKKETLTWAFFVRVFLDKKS